MTTRDTPGELQKAIEATLADIQLCNQRMRLHDKYDYELSLCLLDINKTVFNWQVNKLDKLTN